MTEPPLIILFPDEDHFEFSDEMENKLSVERTGYELTELIEEISDRLAVVTGDTKDLQNLTEAYVTGEITKIASRISEKTIAEAYATGEMTKIADRALEKKSRCELIEDLTEVITSSIYYKILNIIEDSQIAITRGVLTELPTLLGISLDLPT